MSIESVAWNQMYRQAHAPEERRPLRAETARRILRFAAPHRRRIGVFLLFSVVSALLAVATPVLAGRVVNDIVAGSQPRVVVLLAVANMVLMAVATYSTLRPNLRAMPCGHAAT